MEEQMKQTTQVEKSLIYHKNKKRERINGALTLSDIYECYKEHILDTKRRKTWYDVPFKKFSNFLTEANTILSDKIINDAYEHNLGSRLGVLSIRKKRKVSLDTKHLPINWKLTKELGKKVYHLNEHTNGYRFGWMWDKTGVLKYKYFWKFRPTRKNTRALAKVLNNEYRTIDYLEIHKE